MWTNSYRADPVGAAIADRHYNRQSIGSPQFVPPGKCLVLRCEQPTAMWVSSWPLPEYTKHAWAGAWVNTFFRKEGPGKASDFILEAVAATRYYWPNVPELGMITFVNPNEVPAVMRRGKAIYGYCYLMAGFEHVGYTKVEKHWTWQLLPERMPTAAPVVNMQLQFVLPAPTAGAAGGGG